MTEPAQAFELKQKILLVGFDFFDSDYLPWLRIIHCTHGSNIEAVAKSEHTSTIMVRCCSEHQLDQIMAIKSANPWLAIIVALEYDAEDQLASKARTGKCAPVLVRSQKDLYVNALALAHSFTN